MATRKAARKAAPKRAAKAAKRPALKAARAAKASKAPKVRKPLKPKPSKCRPAPGPPAVVAVGDWVLVRSSDGSGPVGLRIEGDGEATEGIVCSIREIASGKLVAKTKGEPGGYLLEVLHHRTFRPQFSSNRNTGVSGRAQALQNVPWARLREILRESAKQHRLYSYASGGLPNEVFGSLLDGWRVVRVRAASVELRQ